MRCELLSSPLGSCQDEGGWVLLGKFGEEWSTTGNLNGYLGYWSIQGRYLCLDSICQTDGPGLLSRTDEGVPALPEPGQGGCHLGGWHAEDSVGQGERL